MRRKHLKRIQKQNSFLFRTTCAVLLACNLVAASAQKETSLLLVKNGKSPYSIIIPAQPTTADTRAAEIFRQSIFRISGAELPVLTDQTATRRYEISIGNTNRLKKLAGKYIPDLSKDPDGYAVISEKGKIYFLGGTHKGVVYGVVSILEKYLGCRKYSPDFDYFPKLTDVRLPSIKISDRPANSLRIINGTFSQDPDYQDWQRLDNIDDVFAKGYYVHTFDRLVPWQQYFESHPEYFALMNGKRVHDQLCLSNPEVLRLTIEKLRQEMQLQPKKQVWSVSQNDNFSYCQCPDCKKIIEEEGSPSGPVIRFVNQVAAAFPDKTISTLAYQYSRKAPARTKPAPNVQIMLCTIEVNRSKPIEKDSSSFSFVQDIRNWGKLTSNLYLWDYTVNFSHHVTPFPNLHVLQPNIQFFTKNHAYQHFQQSNTDIGHEFSELKSYLIARLLWNPYINADSVINDFLNGYYGPAAPWIRKYIDHLTNEIQGTGEWLDIYGSPVWHAGSFLSEKNTTAYLEYFKEAINAVSNNETFLQHVKVAQLPLQYALMEIGKNDMFGPRGWYIEQEKGFQLRPEMREMLEDFYHTCLRNKVRTLNEAGLTPEQYYQSTLRFIDVKVENNKAFRKKVAANPLPAPKYSRGDLQVLTNGVQGASDFKVHWLGWEGTDASIVVDLGSLTEFTEASIGTLYDPKSWILHPASITCMVSADGSSYKNLGNQSITGDQKNEEVTRTWSFTNNNGPARYIRFDIKGTYVLPVWHPSAGGTSWFFTDEVVVK